MVRGVEVEVDEEDQAPSKDERKFYILVFLSKKESKDQDTAHLIPNVQEVCTSILPKDMNKFNEK